MAIAGTIAAAATSLGGGYTRYTVTWASSSGGAVSENPFDVCRGTLRQVKFFPGAGGVQPTDNYDMTLLDADGFDVLGGIGANLSNAAGKVGVPLFGNGTVANFPYFHPGGALTPTIAAAGDSKAGTLVLVIGP